MSGLPVLQNVHETFRDFSLAYCSNELVRQSDRGSYNAVFLRACDECFSHIFSGTVSVSVLWTKLIKNKHFGDRPNLNDYIHFNL